MQNRRDSHASQNPLEGCPIPMQNHKKLLSRTRHDALRCAMCWKRAREAPAETNPRSFNQLGRLRCRKLAPLK